jgi:hypothetical protein
MTTAADSMKEINVVKESDWCILDQILDLLKVCSLEGRY